MSRKALQRGHQPGGGQALPEPLQLLAHTRSDSRTMAIDIPTVEPVPHRLLPSASGTKAAAPSFQLLTQQVKVEIAPAHGTAVGRSTKL